MQTVHQALLALCWAHHPAGAGQWPRHILRGAHCHWGSGPLDTYRLDVAGCALRNTWLSCCWRVANHRSRQSWSTRLKRDLLLRGHGHDGWASPHAIPDPGWTLCFSDKQVITLGSGASAARRLS